MNRTPIALAALALLVSAAAGAFAEGATARAKTPGPTAGTQLATGLVNPRGITMGPDGMLYVAEAGSGGSTAITIDGGQHKVGTTGRISKIDPATGTVTTVASNLPSDVGPLGDAVGPAGVAFLGAQLYYLQTHGGTAYGFPATPTGLYKVNADGTTTLVADIGAFNIANPVADITNGTQKDIEVGGNPYSMTVRGGNFYVVDGNQNQLLQVTPAGTVSRVTAFSGHPVTTGITYAPGGPFYVTTLGQFPFAPSAGTVLQVGYPTGSTNKIAGGVSSLTDVAIGPGGQLYALNFGDQNTSPGPPWMPFTGKILKVNSDGTMTPIVSGFTFATSMIFSGNTAYVVNNGLSALAPGAIWQIPNFSSVTPVAGASPAAAPTAAPAAAAPTSVPATPVTGVTAPNTGTGPAAGTAGNLGWYLVALAAAAAGVAATLAGRRMAARGPRLQR
ncbi:MAG: ScyD/ScyE family protein [Chloroflexota bacterium]|nr:ScyD/ScyE family protein [Chloroflexota bacterium]